MNLSCIPNSISMMNLMMGFSAIVRIGEGRFEEAVWLIALALIADSLDGNVARIFNTTSELGKELDSLGDVVSFVVAPALLVLRSWPYHSNYFMYAVIFFYLGAGAYRLARYNINTSSTLHGYFRGLPTPATAVIVVMTCMGLRKAGMAANFPMTLIYFSWLALLGILMVSKIPYPKITQVHFKEWKGLFLFSIAFFAAAIKTTSIEFAVSVPFILFVFFGIFSSHHVTSRAQKNEASSAKAH